MESAIVISRNEIFFLICLCLIGMGVGAVVGQFPGALNWEAVSGYGSLVSAVATIIAVGLAWIGYRQTMKANALEYRPYLSVFCDALTYDGDEKINGQKTNMFRATVAITNHGRTPARQVTVRAYIHKQVAEKHGNAYEDVIDVLAPSQTQSISARLGGPLGANHLLPGQNIITVVVKLTYDFLDGERDTEPFQVYFECIPGQPYRHVPRKKLLDGKIAPVVADDPETLKHT